MIVYEIDGNAYINTTNRCSNDCTFCVRATSDCYEKFDLWLKKEPTAEEVIEELKKFPDKKEYVFCGYGEPLCALDTVLKVAEELKKQGKKTRMNTNGQADLIVGEGVANRLKGKIDKVSVSLNAPTAAEYQKICRCRFGEEGFDSLLRFASDCKKCGVDVCFSIVDTGDVDIQKAKILADEMGIPLRVRDLIK